MEFISRKYTPVDHREVKEYTFDDIIRKDKIAVILGEPASGKTYQFKQYKKIHALTRMVDLITIEDEEPITNDTELVLIDSIDEAKVKYDNKTLKKKLENFIKKSCFAHNRDVKIIISCRYGEWQEIFSEVLKELDKKLNVYSIQDLDRGDINQILKQEEIVSEEFWIFIENNYLNELLKNIMLTIHVIENFQSYKTQDIKYHDIYRDIVEKNLAPSTDNATNKKLETISIDERFKIVSTLAAYMTLERKEFISIETVDSLSGQLYQVEGIEITGQKLRWILTCTALFVGSGDKVEFFHKSTQEFLTAHFINDKELDITTIKQLFSHDIRFYEGYEEVIIYLTNIEPSYFKHLVTYDPFIFRRHPYLDISEKKLLLVSMIETLKKDRHRAWNRWQYLQNSTLSKFENIENLSEIIRDEIDIKSVDSILFEYLMGILEHNYTQALEDLIFEILENIKDDKKKCIDYMWGNHIRNNIYNKRLFAFIVEHDLFDEDYDSFYIEIFKILYREHCFDELVILLHYFSDISDKKTIFGLDIKDLLLLSREIDDFGTGEVSVIIFALLKKYQELTHLHEKPFDFILSMIEKNSTVFSFDTFPNESGLYRLDFSTFKDDFCTSLFREEFAKRDLYIYTKILNYCDVKLEDIKSITAIYPISKFPKQYQVFDSFEGVEEFLLEDKAYKDLRNKGEQDREKYLLYHEKKCKKQKWYREEREKEEKYKKAIDAFEKTKDFRTVFFLSSDYFNDKEKNHKKLKNDLGSKYQAFVKSIKEAFKEDRLYKSYQDNTMVKKHNDSVIYNFLFFILPIEEIKALVLNADEYEKLFWHLWKLHRSLHGLDHDKFIEISKDYLPTLITQYQNIVIRSLQHEQYPSSGDIGTLKYILREISEFNLEILKTLVYLIKEWYEKNYHKVGSYERSSLLDFIALDKDNYDFICSIMIVDKSNERLYLEHLFLIDLNKAVDDFQKLFFPDKVTYKKVDHLSLTPVYKYDKENDYGHINPIYLRSVKRLFSLLGTDWLKPSELSDEKFFMLLYRYYDYFKEYRHRNSHYDIYAKMNDQVRAYWEYLAQTLSRLPLLQKLSDYPNQRLQAKAKYAMEQIYNNNPELTINYKDALDKFSPKEERFFNHDILTSDLKTIALLLTESRQSISQETEDLINDRFRDALILKEYSVADQSRGGESESGKSVGERDFVIRNNETGVTETVLEGLIFKDKTKTISHFQKLINNYDTVGNSHNYMLVYVKEDNFDNAWSKYTSYFNDFQILESEKRSLKIGETVVNNMKIIHLFINFSSM